MIGLDNGFIYHRANTQCNKHVIITSKRRFDVILTCLLRYVFAGQTTCHYLNQWLSIASSSSIHISNDINFITAAIITHATTHTTAINATGSTHITNHINVIAVFNILYSYQYSHYCYYCQ